jgi:alkanesulfonate monooxygenase SsuD/methylene tetrahydromethanopterin reductase-like flavin-dependent oxidoreductase (luciferase family)
MRIGVKPGQWGWPFVDLASSWAAAEEAGFDLVSCFDHVSAEPGGERQAWDAPTLLAAMAGVTSRVRIAVHVLNVCLRPPFLLAGQLAVAQAASGGRLEVGLGAGSYHLARFDHRAVGVAFPPFEERIDRLEACCLAFPELWRGGTVDDPRLGLKRASLGPIGTDPPRISVGGLSDAVVDVAVRAADAWNVVRPDPGALDRDAERLAAAARRSGRDRAIGLEVQVWARDLDPRSPREHVRRLADAGADTVVLVLDEERGPDAVRRLADAVL